MNEGIAQRLRGAATEAPQALRLSLRELLQLHGEGSGANEELVDALRDLYAHCYSVEPAEVRPAAALRAEAMAVSDRWVADGCDPEDPQLARERALLVRSYAALLAAVHR